MSDLFQQAVPAHYVRAVFEVMRRADHHQFQVLTKRAKRLRDSSKHLPWPQNVWMGVSVESESVMDRVDFLREVPAAIRFSSIEPLISPVERLCLDGIDWVIVGGESGPRSR
jgi:protein gp37